MWNHKICHCFLLPNAKDRSCKKLVFSNRSTCKDWYDLVFECSKDAKNETCKKSGRNEELHGSRDLMRFVKSSSRTSHIKLRTAQSCLLLVAKNLNFAAFSCRYTKQVLSEQKQVGVTHLHRCTYLHLSMPLYRSTRQKGTLSYIFEMLSNAVLLAWGNISHLCTDIEPERKVDRPNNFSV